MSFSLYGRLLNSFRLSLASLKPEAAQIFHFNNLGPDVKTAAKLFGAVTHNGGDIKKILDEAPLAVHFSASRLRLFSPRERITFLAQPGQFLASRPELQMQLQRQAFNPRAAALDDARREELVAQQRTSSSRRQQGHSSLVWKLANVLQWQGDVESLETIQQRTKISRAKMMMLARIAAHHTSPEERNLPIESMNRIVVAPVEYHMLALLSGEPFSLKSGPQILAQLKKRQTATEATAQVRARVTALLGDEENRVKIHPKVLRQYIKYRKS